MEWFCGSLGIAKNVGPLRILSVIGGACGKTARNKKESSESTRP